MPTHAKASPLLHRRRPPSLPAHWWSRFAELLTLQGVPTQTGEFGAHMLVEIGERWAGDHLD